MCQVRFLCTIAASGASPEAGERDHCRRAGEGIVSDQPPPWDPFGQQDLRQGQGQPHYPPRQQPYGQQPYGQQPRQPSFTPDPQYVPSGGRQPYPGPGYGYGPQPPRRHRRKRHRVRNAFAGIGAVVVAIIAIIIALSSHGNGASTTPSGSSAAA